MGNKRVFTISSSFHKVFKPKRFRRLNPKELDTIKYGSNKDLAKICITPDYFTSVNKLRKLLNNGYTPITYIGM